MSLKELNFTEPNCIKEYLSQNILQEKEINLISIKFSKIALPCLSLKDIIIQIEYKSKFYRYYIFSKKPLYLPYPDNINEKQKIKLDLLFNSSQKMIIIGKGSFHINKDNIKAKIFNKIVKISLSREKLVEFGLNQKKGDITEINGTIFIEGNIINKNNINKQNIYINTNYNSNNSTNIKQNSKSSYNISNKDFKKNLNKINSKKIKKIKEEKILIGNKKRTKNKTGKKFNFDLDLDLIDDNSIKFNYLSKKDFSNNSNNLSHFSSFDQNDKIPNNSKENISNNLNFYNIKINKYFNNDLINKLKVIKIKDRLYKTNNNKDINTDLIKTISSNIDIKEQELNKIYQKYFMEKNKQIDILKGKGIQNYKKYIEVKKLLKFAQNEYDENKKKYEKIKSDINNDLQKVIDINNDDMKINLNKALNELFFSLSFKESEYFNSNKFIPSNNNSLHNVNTKKNIKDNDLETMIEILSSLPIDKIDILKGLTNLEKQDAVLIINSSLNKEAEKDMFNNENYNCDENDCKIENDDSSEDKESNTIIQIIEKCVNSYYNKKLIPKIQIEQIDTYHYTFENLKIKLTLDPNRENNLLTSDGENFETWLVNNFTS